MPKVSVVITTFNRAELLKRAISSVLAQTFTDFEVVVVNDASSDNTDEVVQSFDCSQIKYIRHESNAGPSSAKNTGIRNSKGKYIAFLDDDDEWLPEKLQKQVALLDDSPLIVGVVYTGFLKIDRNTGKTTQRVIPSKRGRICYEMALQNWITTSTVIVRKQCFDKVGLFDESIVFGEDYDMWIRISREFEVEYISDSLVHYSVHSKKLSTSYALMIHGMEVLHKKHDQFFLLNKRTYSQRYHNLGALYCYVGKMIEGRTALLTAIHLYPFDPRYYFRLVLSFLTAGKFKKVHDLRERFAARMSE